MTAVERRAQLVTIGRAVFAEHGYEATTVEEIARNAGVSKPIIYEHFGGKEGLYQVILDREMDTVYRRVQSSITASCSLRQRFEQAVLAFLTYVKEQPDGFAVLTRDAPMSAEGRGMSGVMHALGGHAGDVFEADFAVAGVPPDVTRILTHATVGMVTVAAQWWAGGSDIPAEKLATQLSALGWLGLRNLPRDPDPVRAIVAEEAGRG